MYLSSFSLTEPDGEIHLYFPSWLHVWESHVYNGSLKSTNAHRWAFKRFGMTKESYVRETIRTPSYKEYIDAMEQVSDAALHKLSAKERVRLLKSRTAFIYVDTWGESGSFEHISSMLHMATIDTLPKNLVKKFSVSDFTCKIRGEKQSLVQAMKVAQDYLSWDLFDFVVICAAHRAVPMLVFSEEDCVVDKKQKRWGRKAPAIDMNLSVERTGCFIFSQRESGPKVNCGHYIIPGDDKRPCAELLESDPDISLISFTGLRKNEPIRELLNNQQRAPGLNAVSLIDLYGGSGCLSPALGWVYFERHGGGEGKMRTIVPDNFGGYSYFDTWY